MYQLLQRLGSATGVEEPPIFDNQSEDGAQCAAGSSRPPAPIALVIEGREVGRKAKRPDDEDGNFPPQKRRHLEQPGSPSPVVATAEATTSGTGEGEGEGESEEGPVSDGHLGAAVDGVTATDPQIEGSPVDTAEAGPSVPGVPDSSAQGQRRYRPRKLKARKGHNLEELGLRPLNAIEEVGTKMTMAEKLEYVLSRLGRAALHQEIVGALDAGWPQERINRASSVSVLVFPGFPLTSSLRIEHTCAGSIPQARVCRIYFAIPERDVLDVRRLVNYTMLWPSASG